MVKGYGNYVSIFIYNNKLYSMRETNNGSITYIKSDLNKNNKVTVKTKLVMNIILNRRSPKFFKWG